MRLLQHSVRNAFVICVLLLGFTSSVSASFFLWPLTLSSSAESSLHRMMSVGESMTVALPGGAVRCANFYSPIPSAYTLSPVTCTEEHIAAFKPNCTVNDNPYIPGMIEMGLLVEILYYGQNPGTSEAVTLGQNLPLGNYKELVIQSKVTKIGTTSEIIANDSIKIYCVNSGTPSIPMTKDVNTAQRGQRVTVSGTIHINNVSTIDVSVEQPSPVIGKLMTEFDAPFKMTVANALPSENLSMTWDVAAPCDSWSPSLRLPDGSVLGIHHADSGRLPSGISIMTAKFTPTALGAFSCTGTLNVSLD